MTESKEQYSCKLCRNYGKTNYCEVCHCVESPSGKITKPTLWEMRDKITPEELADRAVWAQCLAGTIEDKLHRGETVPIEWIEKYNEIMSDVNK